SPSSSTRSTGPLCRSAEPWSRSSRTTSAPTALSRSRRFCAPTWERERRSGWRASLPQPHVFDPVPRAARPPPKYPRLRALALSAGRGEIAAARPADGCPARGTHFRHDDYKRTQLPGALPSDSLTIDTGVDLTRPLPYDNASFDLVILCEVAEHLPTYMT